MEEKMEEKIWSKKKKMSQKKFEKKNLGKKKFG